MKVTASAGTPNYLESKQCKTPSEVKNFLGDRVFRRRKWAEAHNMTLADELLSIKEQIDSVDINKVKTGDTRKWTAVDEYSGVTFVFELHKDGP